MSMFVNEEPVLKPGYDSVYNSNPFLFPSKAPKIKLIYKAVYYEDTLAYDEKQYFRELHTIMESLGVERSIFLVWESYNKIKDKINRNCKVKAILLALVYLNLRNSVRLSRLWGFGVRRQLINKMVYEITSKFPTYKGEVKFHRPGYQVVHQKRADGSIKAYYYKREWGRLD